MKTIPAKYLILIFLGTLLLYVNAPSASEPVAEGIAHDMEILTAGIEEQRREFVQKALPGEGALNQKFWELDAQFSAARSQNADAYVELINDIAQVLDGQGLEDQAAKNFLDQYIELEEQKLLHRKNQVKLLLKHFGPVFVARFMQVERKFEAFNAAGLAVRIPLIEKPQQ